MLKAGLRDNAHTLHLFSDIHSLQRQSVCGSVSLLPPCPLYLPPHPHRNILSLWGMTALETWHLSPTLAPFISIYPSILLCKQAEALPAGFQTGNQVIMITWTNVSRVSSFSRGEWQALSETNKVSSVISDGSFVDLMSLLSALITVSDSCWVSGATKDTMDFVLYGVWTRHDSIKSISDSFWFKKKSVITFCFIQATISVVPLKIDVN